MRFSVDPWDPTYGNSLEADLGDSSAEIDAGVEVPADQWLPLVPDRTVVAPRAVLFVDGVRRVDAQVWVDEPDGSAAAGLCASYAAGVVCCCQADRAHLVGSHVRRGLFTSAYEAEDIQTSAGSFTAAVTEARPDVPPTQFLSLALQRSLAELELLAADTARSDDTDDDLLVVDGPLHGRQHLPRVIGFVKSHRSDYLPAALSSVVAQLRAEERTPVFRVGSSWERYTWYLRLPCPPGAPWAGVVRVECGAELSAEDAVLLASLSQVTLPRFASIEYKDSRAPQNLYPIAGLERQLRRRLGESALLYRALRKAAANDVR